MFGKTHKLLSLALGLMLLISLLPALPAISMGAGHMNIVMGAVSLHGQVTVGRHAPTPCCSDAPTCVSVTCGVLIPQCIAAAQPAGNHQVKALPFFGQITNHSAATPPPKI